MDEDNQWHNADRTAETMINQQEMPRNNKSFCGSSLISTNKYQKLKPVFNSTYLKANQLFQIVFVCFAYLHDIIKTIDQILIDLELEQHETFVKMVAKIRSLCNLLKIRFLLTMAMIKTKVDVT